MTARATILAVVVLAVAVLTGIYISQEGVRREAAVSAAVEQATAGTAATQTAAVNAAVDAAVAAAVAETEARILAEQPTLPDIDPTLQADDVTHALFPDGSFLLEVGDEYAGAGCRDVRPNVLWVELRNKFGLRATVRRQVVNPINVIVGWMTLGLTAFGGPSQPVQTVFAAGTDGNYTTLILGALRASSDAELVAPQVRLTLYRIDAHTFGVVEWVPMDIAPAARTENAPASFATIYRRCAYVDGAIVDLG